MYNQKLGKYNQYYSKHLMTSTGINHIKNLNFLYKKNKLKITCLIHYPILYKKITFFNFGCVIIKKKRMKNKYNLNQSIIVEGSISANKCIFTIPVLSFTTKFKFF